MIGDDKKRVTVTLNNEVADELEKIAKRMGLSKSGLITVWVNNNRKEFEQKK
ncbi:MULTISPECIES: CopG family transcriptional regulator [unclassified Enterococcus]|uniref:ribbon-helix-helix domain-containing protein n=1 Tax=unclassified Enterococcus TaxID=2608891 RepID=UPI001A9B332C|nr:CopG family transcriptional regulator [Enterococcus sp. DIV1271a]MBO1301013.1 CopG family transcriptional regulator [Enterococcus sp. DIV1271a]